MQRPIQWSLASLLALALSALALVMPGAQVQSGGSVAYVAAWQWGQAIPLPNGSWQTVNDLGYTVTVEEGYVVFASADLIECEHDHATNWWQMLFGGSAHAGHGGGVNPTAVVPVLVESLSAPQTTALGMVSGSEPAYCQGHYVVAQATAEIDQPVGVDLTGSSLYVRGTYQPAGSKTAQPFEMQTALAWGEIDDLRLPVQDGTGEWPTVHAETGSQSIEITVLRNLGTLFNGVDFAHTDETTQAKAILRALTGQTRFLVSSGVAH